MEMFVLFAGAGFAAGWAIRGATDGDQNDEIEMFLAAEREALQQRYETTEMDYVEFGERIAIFENPGTERIMRDAVEVDGIGPETALKIAKQCDGDYSRYRDASQDELEQINGVGESRATALLQH